MLIARIIQGQLHIFSNSSINTVILIAKYSSLDQLFNTVYRGFLSEGRGDLRNNLKVHNYGVPTLCNELYAFYKTIQWILISTLIYSSERI